jgi:Arc/MetJ-type ribon-helix-helix transcriptional regulator
MPYQFPPDIDERVKACLRGGGYQSEDEVIRQAMDALDERERLRRWHERNEIAAEQSRMGLSKPLDLDAVLERVERRFAEQKGE